MHPECTISRQQFVRVCECGCGQPTLLPSPTQKIGAHQLAQPLRFIRGHHARGALCWRWKGGRYQTAKGYVFLYRPDHPNADARGYIEEHRLVVEARIGRYLDPDEIVHHDDENPANNADSNLILTTRADHVRIHNPKLGWRKSA